MFVGEIADADVQTSGRARVSALAFEVWAEVSECALGERPLLARVLAQLAHVFGSESAEPESPET